MLRPSGRIAAHARLSCPRRAHELQTLAEFSRARACPRRRTTPRRRPSPIRFGDATLLPEQRGNRADRPQVPLVGFIARTGRATSRPWAARLRHRRRRRVDEIQTRPHRRHHDRRPVVDLAALDPRADLRQAAELAYFGARCCIPTASGRRSSTTFPCAFFTSRASRNVIARELRRRAGGAPSPQGRSIVHHRQPP